MRFSDLTLHAMIHLSNAATARSVTNLAQAVAGLGNEHMTPAMEKGWVTSRMREARGGQDGATVYELTDSGERLLRHLVDVADRFAAE